MAGTAKPTSNARKAALERAVAEHVNEGWRVKSQADYEARLEKGYRATTGWQVILDVLTLGAYGRMRWGVTGGTERKTVVVDDDANVVEELSKHRGL